VHRFDTARAAYETAASVVGRTPRVSLGLARLAVRAADVAAACAAYRVVDAAASAREQARAEFEEARAYLRASCAPPSPR
jgi:hypothetical protein